MIIKKDLDTIRSYLEDSSNLKGGWVDEVIVPHSIEELAQFLKGAYLKRVPVTISGGGTGTTGGRIPFGGVLISMERFNKIIEISKDTMSGRVQAGVLVEELKDACEKKGLFYPCHPTEKTAFIGGTVATNASGSRSFKYGPTRRYVKYLKMLSSCGDVLEVRRGMKILKRNDSKLKLDDGCEIEIPLPTYKMPGVKNSAGYFAKDGMDLVDLFIGQEGTLSIIVEAEIGLVEKPLKIFSAFAFFKREGDSWDFSEEIKALSKKRIIQDAFNLDALSIEYFDSDAVRLLRSVNAGVPKGACAAIFFEQEITDEGEDSLLEKWTKLITGHNASLDDTWVAMNEKEANRFQEFRHYIPEAINEIVKRSGFQKLSTDIAVPDNKFLEMMNFYVDTFKNKEIEHVIFGHIGESHLHVNILPKSSRELERSKGMCLEFIKKGVSLGGTVSAEHGIGKTRHKYLEEMYGRNGILEMVRIKKALDPNCILGLDNIFSKEML